MRAMVGFTPQSELIVPHRSTNSRSTSASRSVKSSLLLLMISAFGESTEIVNAGRKRCNVATAEHNIIMKRVRVKICGITTADDARLAADCGADAIGINFYDKSPRYIDPRQVGPLLRALPPLLEAIGVFVGLKTRQVCAVAYQLGLHSVQYLADSSDLEDSFPFRRIAAFRVKDRGSIDEIERYLALAAKAGGLPAAVLLDAHVVGHVGGTGQKAPWDLLAAFSPARQPLLSA